MSVLCECGCGERTEKWTSAESNHNRGRISGQHKRFVHGHNTRTRIASPETRRKLSEANSGSNHPQWKGDKAGYQAIHIWIRKHLKRKGECARCNRHGYTEFANISGEYLRDVDDYIELCRTCHKEFDR